MIKPIGSKLLLLIIIVYFSYQLITEPDPWILLDYANWGIHEGGHLIFSLLGETMTFLGGTIFQLLFPVFFLIYFIKNKSSIAIGFCIFWVGNNLINIGRYVRDARAMQLPIIGGGIHDWNWLLGKWGIIEYDVQIGTWVHNVGVVVLAVSVVYLIACILMDIKQFQKKDISN